MGNLPGTKKSKTNRLFSLGHYGVWVGEGAYKKMIMINVRVIKVS